MAKPLVLSYWNLNDLNTGGIRRVNALLRALGDPVVLVQPEPPHPRYETIGYTHHFAKRKQGINWGLFDYFWPPTARLVRRLVRERQPSVIVLTSIWPYFPLRNLHDVPMVLDTHDVNAVAIAERFGARHPFTRLVAAWEKKVASEMDHIFTCSAVDRDQLIARYKIPPERVTVVPNGTDTAKFDVAKSALPADLEKQIGQATVLFFMGKISYQPNAEALKFLSDQVMPELEQKAPSRFKLLVTGGSAAPGTYHPAILFAGMVPEDTLTQILKRADICLAPVFTGSGTRLKILEYMAAGKPVIATAKGAEGLACTSGRELVIAEPDRFVTEILSLSNNPDRAGKMAGSAREFVRTRYDWDISSIPLWRKALGQWLDFEKV